MRRINLRMCRFLIPGKLLPSELPTGVKGEGLKRESLLPLSA